LIAVAPEEITSAATTGRWEKALNQLTQNSDAQSRRERAERFLEGIRRFTVFLVDAAKTASGDVRFEREQRKPARRSAGKSKSAPATRKKAEDA